MLKTYANNVDNCNNDNNVLIINNIHPMMNNNNNFNDHRTNNPIHNSMINHNSINNRTLQNNKDAIPQDYYEQLSQTSKKITLATIQQHQLLKREQNGMLKNSNFKQSFSSGNDILQNSQFSSNIKSLIHRLFIVENELDISCFEESCIRLLEEISEEEQQEAINEFVDRYKKAKHKIKKSKIGYFRGVCQKYWKQNREKKKIELLKRAAQNTYCKYSGGLSPLVAAAIEALFTTASGLEASIIDDAVERKLTQLTDQQAIEALHEFCSAVMYRQERIRNMNAYLMNIIKRRVEKETQGKNPQQSIPKSNFGNKTKSNVNNSNNNKITTSNHPVYQIQSTNNIDKQIIDTTQPLSQQQMHNNQYSYANHQNQYYASQNPNNFSHFYDVNNNASVLMNPSTDQSNDMYNRHYQTYLQQQKYNQYCNDHSQSLNAQQQRNNTNAVPMYIQTTLPQIPKQSVPYPSHMNNNISANHNNDNNFNNHYGGNNYNHVATVSHYPINLSSSISNVTIINNNLPQNRMTSSSHPTNMIVVAPMQTMQQPVPSQYHQQSLLPQQQTNTQTFYQHHSNFINDAVPFTMSTETSCNLLLPSVARASTLSSSNLTTPSLSVDICSGPITNIKEGQCFQNQQQYLAPNIHACDENKNYQQSNQNKQINHDVNECHSKNEEARNGKDKKNVEKEDKKNLDQDEIDVEENGVKDNVNELYSFNGNQCNGLNDRKNFGTMLTSNGKIAKMCKSSYFFHPALQTIESSGFNKPICENEEGNSSHNHSNTFTKSSISNNSNSNDLKNSNDVKNNNDDSHNKKTNEKKFSRLLNKEEVEKTNQKFATLNGSGKDEMIYLNDEFEYIDNDENDNENNDENNDIENHDNNTIVNGNVNIKPNNKKIEKTNNIINNSEGLHNRSRSEPDLLSLLRKPALSQMTNSNVVNKSNGQHQIDNINATRHNDDDLLPVPPNFNHSTTTNIPILQRDKCHTYPSFPTRMSSKSGDNNDNNHKTCSKFNLNQSLKCSQSSDHITSPSLLPTIMDLNCGLQLDDWSHDENENENDNDNDGNNLSFLPRLQQSSSYSDCLYMKNIHNSDSNNYGNHYQHHHTQSQHSLNPNVHRNNLPSKLQMLSLKQQSSSNHLDYKSNGEINHQIHAKDNNSSKFSTQIPLDINKTKNFKKQNQKITDNNEISNHQIYLSPTDGNIAANLNMTTTNNLQQNISESNMKCDENCITQSLQKNSKFKKDLDNNDCNNDNSKNDNKNSKDANQHENQLNIKFPFPSMATQSNWEHQTFLVQSQLNNSQSNICLFENNNNNDESLAFLNDIVSPSSTLGLAETPQTVTNLTVNNIQNRVGTVLKNQNNANSIDSHHNNNKIQNDNNDCYNANQNTYVGYNDESHNHSNIIPVTYQHQYYQQFHIPDYNHNNINKNISTTFPPMLQTKTTAMPKQMTIPTRIINNQQQVPLFNINHQVQHHITNYTHY